MSVISCHADTHPHVELKTRPSGLYYKHITIVNDDSSIVSKSLHTVVSLIDDARVIINDRNVFIIQATGFLAKLDYALSIMTFSITNNNMTLSTMPLNITTH